MLTEFLYIEYVDDFFKIQNQFFININIPCLVLAILTGNCNAFVIS